MNEKIQDSMDEGHAAELAVLDARTTRIVNSRRATCDVGEAIKALANDPTFKPLDSETDRDGMGWVHPRSKALPDHIGSVIAGLTERVQVLDRALNRVADLREAAEKRHAKERAERDAKREAAEAAERDESERVLRALSRAGVKVAAPTPSKAAKP